MLHGWSINNDTHQKWQVFGQQLKERGVDSELLKTPGLSAPLNEVWDLHNYTEWLGEQLQNKKEVILLGHSFGGQIASSYAAQHPDKVVKLILVDSSGIRDHSLIPTVKRSVFLVLSKVGKVFFGFEFARKLLYKLAREKDYSQAPPLLRRTMSKILDDEVVNELPKIECPTLIIWGQDDTVTPVFLGEIFHKHIKKSRMKIIENARHSPQYTHPEQVVDAVVAFVKE